MLARFYQELTKISMEGQRVFISQRLEETKRLHKIEVQRLQRVATEDRNAKVVAEKQRNEALKNTEFMEGKLQMKQTQHEKREEQWREERLQRERDYQVIMIFYAGNFHTVNKVSLKLLLNLVMEKYCPSPLIVLPFFDTFSFC